MIFVLFMFELLFIATVHGCVVNSKVGTYLLFLAISYGDKKIIWSNFLFIEVEFCGLEFECLTFIAMLKRLTCGSQIDLFWLWMSCQAKFLSLEYLIHFNVYCFSVPPMFIPRQSVFMDLGTLFYQNSGVFFHFQSEDWYLHAFFCKCSGFVLSNQSLLCYHVNSWTL